jgi:hypothetical protein
MSSGFVCKSIGVVGFSVVVCLGFMFHEISTIPPADHAIDILSVGAVVLGFHITLVGVVGTIGVIGAVVVVTLFGFDVTIGLAQVGTLVGTVALGVHVVVGVATLFGLLTTFFHINDVILYFL